MRWRRGPRRAHRTWPQRFVIGFNVSVAFCALVLAFALGWANDKLDQIQRIELDQSLDDEPADPGEPQNYLLVGTDSAERLSEDDPVAQGREDLGILSDTIMVLRVDPNATQAQLLSFPRDLWVTIPGLGEQRINTALQGGEDTLIATIQENFGIAIHHYVEVDFLGFQELVSAIDGVPMWFDKPLRDTHTGLNITHAGCITLDPDQALAYARSRHLLYYEDGEWHEDLTADLGRIARQQDFLRRALQRAIAKGVRNPITLNALVNAGLDSVTLDTGLSADDLISLGRRFRSFDPNELLTMSLDVDYDFVGAASILRMADTEANQQRLGIFRGVGTTPSDTGTGGPITTDPASVGVAVLNGTGTSGQAGEVSGSLGALGFDTSPGTGDAENFTVPRTLVRYEAGNEGLAGLVASQLVAGAELQLVEDTGYADVAVVTGADFAGVTTTLTAPPTTAPATSDASTTTTSTTLPLIPTTTQLSEVPPPAPAGEDCG
jgi:polyisoprenyl-teichoic acid--peptidoglycan teichoic acid transferase